MKVIAFNGSARSGGNTALMIKTVFEELEKEGIETEMIEFSGKTIKGCTACGYCSKEKKCIIKDELNEWAEKIGNADGMILGSPTYFADMTPETKAFIDRVGRLCRINGYIKHKIGASVVAVRRAGAINAFDSMNHFFQINEAFLAGSTYWNIGFGLNKGDFLNDEEGITTMKNLGKNIAWFLKNLKH